MKKLFVSFIIMAFSCSLHSYSSVVDYGDVLGQRGYNPIYTAVPFLMIAPDARSAALGDAGVSSCPDINSMHWNPAKYAFFRDDALQEKDDVWSLAVNYTPWLRTLVPDVNLFQAVAVHRPDSKQAFALSARYFTPGDVNITDDVGNYMGTVRPNELALDIAYARKLSDNFSGAIALRYIRSDLTQGQLAGGMETKAGTSLAFDLATYYSRPTLIMNVPAEVAAGVNISNIGQKISYTDEVSADFIPVNLRLGPSITMFFQEHRSLSLMLDFNKLLVPTPPIFARDENGNVLIGDDGEYVIESGRDPNRSVFSGIFGSFSDAPGGFSEELREITISFGAEYVMGEHVTFRAGYFHEHETKGNRQYYTAGLGLRYRIMFLDLAYLIPVAQRSSLKNVLRFSFGLHF